MIGIHAIIRNDNLYECRKDCLIKESWHSIENCYSDSNVDLLCSKYEGYPIRYFDVGTIKIFIEGMIYNLSVCQQDDWLRNIANSLSTWDSCKNKIREFVSQADGDFLVLLFDKNSKQIVVFNDILGSVPLFYSKSGNRIILGRNISFILENSNSFSFNREAITEFIIHEFNSGKFTYFNDIFKLEPAQILLCKYVSNEVSLDVSFAVKENFSLTEKFKSREDAISCITEVFLDSLKDRVRVFGNGSRIVNTLSGGFDSRAVFGGLNRITDDFVNITYKFYRDECEIAKKLIEVTNSKSALFEISVNEVADLNGLDRIYKTNGLVNNLANSVIYNGQVYLKKHFNRVGDVVFAGFGGEYIRHPIKDIVSPFTYMSMQCKKMHVISAILKTNYVDLKYFLNYTFNRYN